MEQIIDFFSNIFNTESWPARWHCGSWTSFHGWLYIISDLIIWASYFAIPVILYMFIYKKKHDLPFVKIFWLFILFILGCGATHFIDALMFWHPFYRLNAFILFLTAFVSLLTVIGLIKVLPEALKLKSPKELEKIIRERTGELETTNQNLVKLNNDIDNFVYAASHNLKSPINNIEGLLLVLKEDLASDQSYNKVKEVTDRMENSVTKVKQSIDYLTDIIKLQKNPYDDIESIKFENLINEIAEENEALIKSTGTIIKLDLKADSVVYSKTGLKSILYNLINNAIKYRSDVRKPEILIESSFVNNKLALIVQDNGLGIDLEKNREKLFILFKRFHSHVEGSGIGLYMIKRLIEDKGGSIDVESTPNEGTRFKVIF